MILKDYIKAINQLVQEHPEALNMQLVHSKDREGNTFHEVIYTPTIGHFNDDNNDFVGLSEMEKGNFFFQEPNAVCVN
jgi:hypothetical protein